MYNLISPAKGHPQFATGSSGATVDIKVPAKSVELSTLYAMLPSHYAKLSKGLAHPEVASSRLRLGNTCAFNPFTWESVLERVTDLFTRGKLRNVATVEEAHAEIGRVKEFYDLAIQDR